MLTICMFLFRFSLSPKHSTENQMCTLRGTYERRVVCFGASHIIPVRSKESQLFFLYRKFNSVPDDSQMTTAKMFKLMQLPTVTFRDKSQATVICIKLEGKYKGIYVSWHFKYASFFLIRKVVYVIPINL